MGGTGPRPLVAGSAASPVGRSWTASAAPDAVGLTGQMHSAVALGPEHAPLGPAILWNDQRTVRECAELRARIGDALATWTGNPIRTGFTATKILWLRRHRPDLYGRLSAILLPKDFLRLRLTGVLATDVTDASGTGLFDVPRRRWSEEALEALEIQRAWMPEVHELAALVSEVDRRGARASALPVGTPVAAGAGDQAAAALGSGAAGSGTLSITLGTSATVQLPTALPMSDPSGVFQTFCHGLPGTWQLLAAVLSGGGSLDWYQRLADASARIAAGAPDEACRVRAAVQRGGYGPAGRRRSDLSALPHGRSCTASRSRGSWRMVWPDPSPRPSSSGPRRDRRRCLCGPRRGRGRRGADGQGTRDPGERGRQPRPDLAPDARQRAGPADYGGGDGRRIGARGGAARHGGRHGTGSKGPGGGLGGAGPPDRSGAGTSSRATRRITRFSASCIRRPAT